MTQRGIPRPASPSPIAESSLLTSRQRYVSIWLVHCRDTTLEQLEATGTAATRVAQASFFFVSRLAPESCRNVRKSSGGWWEAFGGGRVAWTVWREKQEQIDSFRQEVTPANCPLRLTVREMLRLARWHSGQDTGGEEEEEEDGEEVEEEKDEEDKLEVE